MVKVARITTSTFSGVVTESGNHASKNDAGKITAWWCSTPHVRRGSHSPGWRAGCIHGVDLEL